MSKRTISQIHFLPPARGTLPQPGNSVHALGDLCGGSANLANKETPSMAQMQQPPAAGCSGNNKRRSTIGSRLSVHSLFFPSAYSTSVGGTASSGAAPAAANVTNAQMASATKWTKAHCNRPNKMSRSTNDLQTPVAGSVLPNENVKSKNTAAIANAGASNRSGSMERLLVNANTSTTGRVSVVVDSKTAAAPSGDSPASRSGSASDHDQDSVANLSTVTAASVSAGSGTGGAKVKMRECPLCLARQPSVNFPQLSYCHHRSCQACLVQYLHMEILESRVNVTCPECNEPMHPNDIYKILSVDDPNSAYAAHRNHHLIEKYEEFSVRRVLMSDPDTRWCPAPDCSYAVIATGCAACPELRCQRPGCGTLFCYHCKMTWHPNQTCDEARAQRGSFATSPLHIDTTIRPGDIKACPRCRTYIVKMNDGSCNHMICALCGAEFCWLCLREVSDLHYLSPSGCTFWGKKPWSRKKKLLWQLGMLVGAPVGIALVAGLAVPAIIFGVPVWVGRKVHQKLKDSSKAKRRVAIAGSVFGSVLMSPVLASMAVGVGVPILLAYVYGVVPLSLCRNGSCGVTASSSGVRLDLDDDILAMTSGTGGDSAGNYEKAQLLKDIDKQDASTVTGFSMQSGSTQHKLQIQADVCSTGTAGGANAKNRRSSLESGATASLCGDRCFINYEEASTRALAGSTYCDDKSVHTMGSLLESGGGSYFVEADQTSGKVFSGSVGGAGAETKSSKSINSGAMLGHSSSGAANVDNASIVAMAGSICGVTVDSSGGNPAEGGQCSRCGGRRSSSVLRTTPSLNQHHHHVHIDEQFIVDEHDRSERDCVREPRVTRFADDPCVSESADASVLERHYGFLPIDEESNTNTTSSASKIASDDQPVSLKSAPILAHRQPAEKPSSLRRFLFLRGGATTSEEAGKHQRSSVDSENASGAPIDLKSICTSIGGTNTVDSGASVSGATGEERRCRLHRDQCQCDDAEFLLLPPDACIIQHQRYSNPTGPRRFSASSGSGRMKKSRSWSALLLEGGGGGQSMTSSIAAELWSTVRGAFTSGANDSDVEHGHHRFATRNPKRGNHGSGLVQRLRSGRRATVSTSVANVATTSKRLSAEKKASTLYVGSSCTSLPDTYVGPLPTSVLCGVDNVSGGGVSIALPVRQRTPSGSSPSRATGGKRLSSTLVRAGTKQTNDDAHDDEVRAFTAADVL